MVHVEVVPTAELGDRSYVAHDGTRAIVVDPQRDTDRIEAVLAAHRLRCALVVETHVHNDYLTGGFQLARTLGVPYGVSAADDVTFERLAVSDGDELSAGTMTLRAIATPGHTPAHLAYVVSEAGQVSPPVVFTGGSLLFGSVGRTDLVGAEHTDELAHAQYHSAHRLAGLLPEPTPLYPTHGFGSFCSSMPSTGGDESTVGQERRTNRALTDPDEDHFVAELVAGLTAYPAYYAHMAPMNAAGPPPVDLSAPAPVDADELHKRIADGAWVVDLRDRRVFAGEHLAGTLSVDLAGQFATYLGWVLPWGTPLTVLGADAEQVAGAQRQLVRIGIDRLAGAATGTPRDYAAAVDLRAYPTATFTDLAHRRGPTAREPVLDVRRDDERARGGIPAAHHVPLPELLSSLDTLPPGRLWVHCAAGFRASIAASLLDRAGRDVVLVDDDYATAVELGLATG